MKFFLLVLLSSLALILNAESLCDSLNLKLLGGDIDGALRLVDLVGDSDDADCNNLKGEIYLRRGRNDMAETFFKKALSLAEENSNSQANSLNNLGLVYWNTGNNNQAKEYLLQALKIRENTFGKMHEETAASLNDLGLVMSNSDPEAALSYYQQALSIYQSLGTIHLEKIAQSKLNIGVIYRELGNNLNAMINFKDAQELWRKLYGDNYPNIGFAHANLGQTYFSMGNYSEALEECKKALEIYQLHFSEIHPDLAYINNLMGNIYHSDQEYEQALEHYQKALIANSANFKETDPKINPTTQSFYNQNTLLSTLYYKAQAFMDKSRYKTLKFNELRASLKTLYLCDSLVDYIRQHRTNESDKIALGLSASNVYETGVILCDLMANEAIKKEQYYEQSFYFSEKSKSAVLLEAISDAAAKSFAGIPNNELEKENLYKTGITFYEQELAKLPEEDMAELFRENLFNLKRDYNQFITQLEERYPKYYHLKYNISVPAVSDIQEILEPNSAILSYFLSESNHRIYTYLITKNEFVAESLSQNENFSRYISGMKNGIIYQVVDLYQLTAISLHKTLIPNSIPKNVDKLIIIPTGRLGTVSFGALLTGKVRGKEIDYSELPYLTKQYAISYQYSSTLFYQLITQKHTSGASNSVFLCAPIHFSGKPDLPWTMTEISELQEIFSNQALLTQAFVESDANESSFKSANLNDFRYLHFATHGLVDEVNPSRSRIWFYPDQLSSEDGSLYSGEIYNLKLSAQLVTLSACETGLGKISRGEGIIGLSRAFAYAGANNIMVSLWSVSDESTSQLMIKFYEAAKDENFSEALRQAQLQLIEQDSYSKPYYWAPFILVGQ